VLRQRDELRDVDALVPDALDGVDQVQHGGDDAQVAGDGSLQGQQREHALMDLEVATVDAVVVGDDEVGEHDVDARHRIQYAVELAENHVQRSERAELENAHLLLKLRASPGGRRHQLNLPVTYSSVRALWGVLNSFSVGACSISSPR